MFKSISIGIIAALALSSVLVIAGSVNDSYNVGDTLTTTILDNIKAAINDNNNASRFYGDGSAGNLTVSSNVTWAAFPPTGNNLNFTDLTIDAGSTLSIPAGTVIRCTGTFANNGTITVFDAGNHGVLDIRSYSFSSFTAPGRGDASRAAGMPDAHTALGVTLFGGKGGRGIPKTVAASSFNNFTRGGGGGVGSVGFGVGYGDGGGLVKIYCQGAVINNGVIEANGSSGVSVSTFGGGGGGGVPSRFSRIHLPRSTGDVRVA